MKFFVIISDVVIEINYVIVCNPKQQLTKGRCTGSKNHSKELENKVIDLVTSGMTCTKVVNFYNIPRNSGKSIVRKAKPQNLINNLIASMGTRVGLYPMLMDQPASTE